MTRRVLAEADLGADRAAAGQARRLVAGALREHGLDVVVDAAEILVSEVVTNALLHARSACTVRVVERDGAVEVEVLDASPVLPVRKRYGADATTGRGLLLVETLAAEWGARPTDDGKCVWFLLDPSRPSGSAVDSFDQAAADLDDDLDLEAIAARFGEVEGLAEGGAGGRPTALARPRR